MKTTEIMGASYFPHDSNARNDEKLIRLRMRWKSAGYGVYFMILERMREERNYMCVKDYNVIAFDLREDAAMIKSVVEDFGLFVFTSDGKYFYSESFLSRMEAKDDVSNIRRKAALKRWKSEGEKPDDANAMQMHAETDANAMQENKRKVKKSKEKKESSTAPARAYDVSEAGFSDELLGNDAWREAVMMRYGVANTAIEEWMRRFMLDQDCRGNHHQDLSDFRRHFADWLRIQIENNKQKTTNGTIKANAQPDARELGNNTAAADVIQYLLAEGEGNP